MEYSITVEGIEEAAEMLGGLPRQIVAQGFLVALQAAGNVLKAGLQRNTPVEDLFVREKDEDPHLIDSIVVEVSLDADFRGGTVEIGFGKQGHKALWVEYGHRLIGHKPKKRDLGAVPPHPFMRPTVITDGEAAVEAFGDALIAQLKSRGLLDAA